MNELLEFNVKKSLSFLEVTKHSVKRIHERVGINKADAKKWADSIAKRAKYVSLSTGSDGRSCRMFAIDGYSLKVALESDVLITLYKAAEYQKRPIFKRIEKVLHAELHRAESSERKEIRSIQRYHSELLSEMSELVGMLSRARSLPRRLALQARINAVQLRIDDMPSEIHESKRKKTRIAEGVAAYL